MHCTLDTLNPQPYALHQAKWQLRDGVPYRLRVVAQEGLMGFGVRAEDDIPRGRAVCEYGGVFRVQGRGLGLGFREDRPCVGLRVRDRAEGRG